MALSYQLHFLNSLRFLATASIAILASVFPAFAADDDNSSCSYDLSVSYGDPVAADGWSYRLVAKDLERPRGILFDTEGALLAVESGVGIVHLELEDNGGTCLQVKEKKTLVKNEDVSSLQSPERDPSHAHAGKLPCNLEIEMQMSCAHFPGLTQYPLSSKTVADYGFSSSITVLPSPKMAAPSTPPPSTTYTPGPTMPPPSRSALPRSAHSSPT